MKKRILVFAFCVSLCVTEFPMNVFAEETQVVSEPEEEPERGNLTEVEKVIEPEEEKLEEEPELVESEEEKPEEEPVEAEGEKPEGEPVEAEEESGEEQSEKEPMEAEEEKIAKETAEAEEHLEKETTETTENAREQVASSTLENVVSTGTSEYRIAEVGTAKELLAVAEDEEDYDEIRITADIDFKNQKICEGCFLYAKEKIVGYNIKTGKEEKRKKERYLMLYMNK